GTADLLRVAGSSAMSLAPLPCSPCVPALLAAEDGQATISWMVQHCHARRETASLLAGKSNRRNAVAPAHHRTCLPATREGICMSDWGDMPGFVLVAVLTAIALAVAALMRVSRLQQRIVRLESETTNLRALLSRTPTAPAPTLEASPTLEAAPPATTAAPLAPGGATLR